MPAKAAELVNKAEKRDRQAVAVTAVRAIAQKHRAATPLVISAVSKAAPDLASAVAVAASEVVSDQAGSIARAAAISAPTHASEVVAAVSQAVPSQANSIASTVGPVMTRPSASTGSSSGGTVTISNKPINGTSNFPLNAPKTQRQFRFTTLLLQARPPSHTFDKLLLGNGREFFVFWGQSKCRTDRTCQTSVMDTKDLRV